MPPTIQMFHLSFHALWVRSCWGCGYVAGMRGQCPETLLVCQGSCLFHALCVLSILFNSHALWGGTYWECRSAPKYNVTQEAEKQEVGEEEEVEEETRKIGKRYIAN